jgi:branched-chain amino acid transport system ATP-binding protein
MEIGRALMAEPKLVLLDDPTPGVNPTLQNEIGERLLELPRRGITVLLIEHDMGFIAHLCDPVIVMAEGQVLTEGSFDAVREDHRVREAYLGRRSA